MDHGRLAPWLDSPASAAVLTDFDGTLSPIVADPASAEPLPGAADRLAQLARCYHTVAVISGRPVAYLLERLGVLPGVTLVGLYGLEKGTDGAVAALPEASRWRSRVDEVAEAARTGAPAGVGVEHKGLTVVLHVRQAPQHAGWVESWAREQAQRTGLVLRRAKMAVELVPPVERDKGDAVAELGRGLGAVCYLGDDLGDLAAFGALTQLAGRGAATLAVAVASEESPAAVLAAADLVVDGPHGALEFLDALQPG